MAKSERRVTSADVARASGVSRATVSYVLNDDPRQSIAPETRERVLEAARTLGYRPFAAARILRAGHSQLVLGVLQFEQVDPSIARELKELEARLATHGFNLIWHVGVHTLTGPTHPSTNLTPAVVISFVDESDPAIQAFLQAFDVPVLSMVKTTSREAVGRAQVAYLAERGYQRIVFAAPERRDVQRLVQARLQGVRRECAERGLAPPTVQVIPASRSGARDALGGLLQHQQPPLGMCCYNDEVAFGVLAALSDLKIAIPEAVAVIGCDDIPLAEFSVPALTTICFEGSDFRDLLIENILAASEGKPTRAAPPVPLSVVVRESA